MRNISGLFWQAGYKPGFVKDYDTHAPFIGDMVFIAAEKPVAFEEVETKVIVHINQGETDRDLIVECRYRMGRRAAGILLNGQAFSLDPFNAISLHATPKQNTLAFGNILTETPGGKLHEIPLGLDDRQINCVADGLGERTLGKLGQVMGREALNTGLTRV